MPQDELSWKILVQSVLTPRFMLVNTRVSKGLMDSLDKEFSCFLWDKSDGSHGMSLVGWSSICRTHKYGGLDIQ